MEETVTLSRNLAVGILNYLQTRPFNEVAQACLMLQQALNTPAISDEVVDVIEVEDDTLSGNE